jgi:hypothetical protein
MKRIFFAEQAEKIELFYARYHRLKKTYDDGGKKNIIDSRVC